MSNSKSKKESYALRQQKYSNAIIRGRRHVPTPEAVPPSSLLDAPPLSPVPLPSPPREPIPKWDDPPRLVTNLNRKQPAPQGGFTAANRYAKTPTHLDENAKVFEEYAERMNDIQQKQNNMGEGKRPRKPSRRPQTPALVSMMMGSMNDEKMTEMDCYMATMDSRKKAHDPMGADKTRARTARKHAAKAPTLKSVEEQQVFSLGRYEERVPTAAEYNDRMGQIIEELRSPEPAGAPTPTMDKQADCGAAVTPPDYTANVRLDNVSMTSLEACDLDWQDEGQVRSCYNTSPQPGHLSREADSPTIQDTTKDWMYFIRKAGREEMMESDPTRDEDRRTPVQGKTTKNKHKARKERLVLPSLTSDPGLMLQGTKLHTPGVSLPSIGDGVLSTATRPNIPDEDMGTQLPPTEWLTEGNCSSACYVLPSNCVSSCGAALQFGTKQVGKTTSDTVTFKQPSDKSKVRSTKRRQKTDRASLKDKKSQKRRHNSPDPSSPDFPTQGYMTQSVIDGSHGMIPLQLHQTTQYSSTAAGVGEGTSGPTPRIGDTCLFQTVQLAHTAPSVWYVSVRFSERLMAALHPTCQSGCRAPSLLDTTNHDWSVEERTHEVVSSQTCGGGNVQFLYKSEDLSTDRRLLSSLVVNNASTTIVPPPTNYMVSLSLVLNNTSTKLVALSLVLNNKSIILVALSLVLKNTSTRLVALSLVVNNTSTRLVSLSLVLNNTSTRLVALSLVLNNTSTRLVSLSLVLNNTSTRLVSLSLVLNNTSTRLVSLSLVLKNTSTRLVALPLVLNYTLPRLVSLSLVLNNTSTRLVSLALVLKNTSTRLVALSLTGVHVPGAKNTSTRLVALSLVLIDTLPRLVPLSLVLNNTSTRLVALSLVLKNTSTRLVTLSLVLNHTSTRLVSLSLVLNNTSIRLVSLSLVRRAAESSYSPDESPSRPR
ncbi:hypothetical protein Bbelb_341440 [Branchiostoma belcheri]|nr:hypothetical protein Bbelb_341440 [Branchiostoma belcheri]